MGGIASVMPIFTIAPKIVLSLNSPRLVKIMLMASMLNITVDLKMYLWVQRVHLFCAFTSAAKTASCKHAASVVSYSC